MKAQNIFHQVSYLMKNIFNNHGHYIHQKIIYGDQKSDLIKLLVTKLTPILV
jgi:hypothetical protein